VNNAGIRGTTVDHDALAAARVCIPSHVEYFLSSLVF